MATATALPVDDLVRFRHTTEIRDRFLTGDVVDLSGVRPIIARSWKRSRAAGIDAVEDRGISDAGRVDEHTMLAAEEHLRKLDEVVADMGGYISLTAPNGALVKPEFLRDGDEFPAGYSLLEESCGSNGEGLAIEEGRAVWLSPEEHFREDMRSNWCFASLIRDPFHNRVRAVIGLTLPASHVRGIEPSTTLLMLEGVTARIERAIEARTSSKERALLTEYLTVSRRRGNSSVVAVDGRNTILNSVASSSLEGPDFSVISSYAKAAMTTGDELVRDAVLDGVGAARVEVTPVRLSTTNVGAIVVVRPHAAESTQTCADALRLDDAISNDDGSDALFPTLDGTSLEFRRIVRLARNAVTRRRSVAIIGEEGSGRRRLAHAIASAHGPSLHFDVRLQSPDRPTMREVLELAKLEEPGTLIIEHADELSQFQAYEVAKHFRGDVPTRLVFTLARSTDASLHLAEVCEVLEIAVAPLRNRREDIPLLAAAIAREVGHRKLSRQLIATLTSADWPRNIDQLRSVVSNAAERASGREVTTDDLPQGFHRLLTEGRLSRLEDAELSEMRAALQEAKGNRRLAAEMLQIGRSTLYRRMTYFRSRGFDV